MQVRKLAAALAASGVVMAGGLATAGVANAATTATASSQVVPAGWYISGHYATNVDCTAFGGALVYFGLARSYYCDGNNTGANPWTLWVLPF